MELDAAPHPRNDTDNHSHVEDVAHTARLREIRRDVGIAETGPAFGDDIVIGDSERFAIPVLEHSIEQIEVLRRVDDPGRVARSEANGNPGTPSGLGHLEETHRLKARQVRTPYLVWT